MSLDVGSFSLIRTPRVMELPDWSVPRFLFGQYFYVISAARSSSVLNGQFADREAFHLSLIVPSKIIPYPEHHRTVQALVGP